jgi:biotin transport system substrate-specific component
MIVTNSENSKIPFLSEFLWALIGLCLTIFGTFVEVFVFVPRSNLNISSFELTSSSLGITYQLAGLFLTACMGGKNAAAYSQIAYVILGLFKLPVFYQGGTFEYLQYPSFGYILGFIPGAWLCGFLVLPGKRRLELFAISSFFGLLVIHLCGIIYLIGYSLITPLFGNELADNYILEGIKLYSLNPFPSQLALICAVSVLAFILRLVLMY